MYTIAICDDEILERADISSKIKKVLEKNSFDYDISEFTSGEQLLSIEAYFDIVFLDIKMDKLSGIDTARKIRKSNTESKIIFVTAFEEYVFDSFDVSPFQYLLKPVCEEKILEIMNKIYEESCEAKKDDLYIIVNQGRSTLKISLQNIYYFEVKNRIINIHTENEVIEFYGKISEIENKVSEKAFFRCHRSYIVNFKYVKKFDKTCITLDNNEEIMLSKYRYDSFTKEFLKNMKSRICFK